MADLEKVLGAYEFKSGSVYGIKLKEGYRWRNSDRRELGTYLKQVEKEMGVRFFLIPQGLDVISAAPSADNVAEQISSALSKTRMNITVNVADGSVTA